MTKPSTATDRELFGIIGKVPNASKVQREWNLFFKENGMDAFMSKYPTTTENLPERLSEMFHFDRRIYLVGPELSDAVIPLLDSVEGKSVNVIVNKNGVMKGIFADKIKPSIFFAKDR